MASRDPTATPPPSGPSRATLIVVITLWIAVLGLMWLPQLGKGLSSVEVITDWMVRGARFGTMWWRSNTFQVHSWYVVLPWLQAQLWPAIPAWFLRLPSIACVFGAAGFVHAITRRFGGREAGLWAVTVFIATTPVLTAATTCRPYGLGLLLVTASMHSFLRWLHRDQLRDGLIAVVLSGLAANVHILLGTLGLVQLLVTLTRRRDWLGGSARPERSHRQLGLLVLVAASFSLPVLHTTAQAFGRREVYSWPAPPTAGGVIFSLLPMVLWIALPLLGLLVLVLGSGPRTRRLPISRADLGTLVVWWLLPPLLLAAASTFGSTQVFAPRYYIAAFPAAAVLSGLALASLRGADVRAISISVAVGLWIAASWSWSVHLWDSPWRDEAEDVASLDLPDDTLVLYHPPFIEASSPDWLRDPERYDYLRCPLIRYPVGDHVLLGTRGVDGAQADYLQRDVLPQLLATERFLIVGWRPELLADWARDQLGDHYQLRPVGRVFLAERVASE